MDLDRQAIERRDFPIGRRGYDPAAVDAHLRALAVEFEELKRASAEGAREPSLATTAASQVQSILRAAETAAADIESQAAQSASDTREEADRAAAQTRADAVRRAQAHVAAVAQATSVLLERVATMDGEVSSLLESLRAGAGRLATDLAAVETNMADLYDAASGRPAGQDITKTASTPTDSTTTATATPAMSPAAVPAPPQAAAPTPPPAAAPTPPPAVEEAPAPGNGDLDGARLVALNMALNGESRAEADRYLAENFQLADRQKLIDEVYAAIES
ncbi:MAG: DivIVA domain-containing protein [Solirubrobacteraceae bacterium]